MVNPVIQTHRASEEWTLRPCPWPFGSGDPVYQHEVHCQSDNLCGSDSGCAMPSHHLCGAVVAELLALEGSVCIARKKALQWSKQCGGALGSAPSAVPLTLTHHAIFSLCKNLSVLIPP